MAASSRENVSHNDARDLHGEIIKDRGIPFLRANYTLAIRARM
jgi:hypothetical protein